MRGLCGRESLSCLFNSLTNPISEAVYGRPDLMTSKGVFRGFRFYSVKFYLGILKFQLYILDDSAHICIYIYMYIHTRRRVAPVHSGGSKRKKTTKTKQKKKKV